MCKVCSSEARVVNVGLPILFRFSIIIGKFLELPYYIEILCELARFINAEKPSVHRHKTPLAL